MSIITISRGSYSKGKEVAERVAKRLGYSCISRDILVETSEHFNIPEMKLVRALHDAPSILDRFTYGKERYLAYIESTLFEYARKDNVVYHGLAGHFILGGVKHLLRIRILANIEDRVALEVEREKISSDEALHLLKKDDHERRQWSLKLFGLDTWDPSLYDLVIHIHKITVADAVDIICQTVEREQFKTTPEAQKAIEDLALAARVRAALVSVVPNVGVSAVDGKVYVDAKGGLSEETEMAAELKDLARVIPGVKDVAVHITPPSIYG
ncbi:MAG TPA: cytidylate kinase-like family protein [Desulfomonilaceae bacterium]|nr:cytidylate kinase-like family protein [Desulfomonilaceae bacterium]